MSTVTIVLTDMGDGMVDVETTVTDWQEVSRAIALADRINSHLAQIAEQQGPTERRPVAEVVG